MWNKTMEGARKGVIKTFMTTKGFLMAIKN